MANKTKEQRKKEFEEKLAQSVAEDKIQEEKELEKLSEDISNGNEKAKEVIKEEIKLEKNKEKEEPRKVEVDISFLEDMRKEQEALKEKINFLEEISDKESKANYLAKHKKKQAPEMKLRLFENKIVIAWRTIKNDVWVDTTGKIIEDQIIEITLRNKDGQVEKKKMSLVQFNRHFNYINCRMIEKREIEGSIFFTLERLDNGDKIEINEVYVN